MIIVVAYNLTLFIPGGGAESAPPPSHFFLYNFWSIHSYTFKFCDFSKLLFKFINKFINKFRKISQFWCLHPQKLISQKFLPLRYIWNSLGKFYIFCVGSLDQWTQQLRYHGVYVIGRLTVNKNWWNILSWQTIVGTFRHVGHLWELLFVIKAVMFRHAGQMMKYFLCLLFRSTNNEQ